MNEVLTKIAKEAMVEHCISHVRLQAFAELIIKECADIATINQFQPYTAGSYVLKHFGVEEQVQDSKELHTCPYREEIHGDYETLCDCDEEQQHQCAMDI